MRDLDLRETAELSLTAAELWTLYASCRLYNRGEPLRIVRAIHQAVIGERSLLEKKEEAADREAVVRALREPGETNLRLTRQQLAAAQNAVRDVSSAIADKRARRGRTRHHYTPIQQIRAVRDPSQFGVSTRLYHSETAERLLAKLKRTGTTQAHVVSEADLSVGPEALIDGG